MCDHQGNWRLARPDLPVTGSNPWICLTCGQPVPADIVDSRRVDLLYSRTAERVIIPNTSGPLVEVVNDDGDTMVMINRDGTVTYGNGVDLDAASRRFWDALAANIPPTLTDGGLLRESE